jgi:surface protein
MSKLNKLIIFKIMLLSPIINAETHYYKINTKGMNTDDFISASATASNCTALSIRESESSLADKISNGENVSGACTDAITDMSYLFYGISNFNQDLSGWDVSNVTGMFQMFSENNNVVVDLSSWDVSNVVDMGHVFYSSINSTFNVGNWKLSKVESLSAAFEETNNMTIIGIKSWDTSNVINMSRIFSTSDFNQDISIWNTGNVTNMHGMFENATSFNQDISGWDVSSVTYSSIFSLNSPINGTAFSPF